MTATTTVQPPGQLHLVPPAPTRTSTSYRIVTPPADATSTPRWSDAIRDLPIAASRTHAAARRHSEAWMVAADGSAIHVTAAGDITTAAGTELSGWAAMAARVINQNTKGPLAP